RRKRKYLYGKTYEDVRQRLSRTVSDRDQGVVVPTERQTVGDFLTRWLADVVEGTRRPSTHRSYEQYIRLHIVPIVGKKQLAKLTAQDVQALLKNRRDSGLAARTVRYVYTVLHLALDQAVKWQLIPRNVADFVDKPKTTRFEGRWLNDDEARRFLDTT